jgi:SAM-dependent methyltransferase
MTNGFRAHPGRPYFTELGNTLGDAYLRYDFTRGTEQEVEFLLALLDLSPGARVLDVGCGPGRHAAALAAAGLRVTGVDVSPRFLELAASRCRDVGVGAAFFECDARQMPFDDEFDAVIAICEGAFGVMGEDDALVLRRMTEAVRRAGRVVLTAFSALYEARHPREDAHFDLDTGIVYERTTIKDESGRDHPAELWTSVYTPRELRLLAIGCGLVPENVWGVEPGDFGRRPPDFERPELMLVARKP